MRFLIFIIVSLIAAPAFAAADQRAVPAVSYQCPDVWGERQYGIPPQDGEKRPRYYFDFEGRSETDLTLDLKELDWILTNCQANKKPNGLPPPGRPVARP